MKKSTKIIIISAALLVVLGLIVGFVAVVFMGAAPHKLFADGTYTISYDDIFHVNKTGGSVTPTSSTNGFGGDRDGNSISSESSGEAAANKLNISWISGKVTVISGDVDKITFSESSNEKIEPDHCLSWRVENGCLYIEHCKNEVLLGFGGNCPGKDLTVTVPRDMASVLVSTVSGDVELQNVTCGRMYTDSTSGCVTASSCHADEFSFNSVSGVLNFNGYTREFEADTTSGDVNVFFSDLPTEFEADTVSGNVYITIPDDSAFDIEYDTISGDFHCDFETRHHDGHHTHGHGGCEFSVDTTSGNCHIYRK